MAEATLHIYVRAEMRARIFHTSELDYIQPAAAAVVREMLLESTLLCATENNSDEGLAVASIA